MFFILTYSLLYFDDSFNNFHGSFQSESDNCSVMSNSLQPHGLQPTRLLCPWNSLGKNSGMCCHLLLQGIFSTQGSNPGLLHCRQFLYHEVPSKESHKTYRLDGCSKFLVLFLFLQIFVLLLYIMEKHLKNVFHVTCSSFQSPVDIITLSI